MPNCPKMSRQILAPVLAWGAEPKPLLVPPSRAQLACHCNRILSQGTSSPLGKPKTRNPFQAELGPEGASGKDPGLADSPHTHTWSHYRVPPTGWRRAAARHQAGSLGCCGREPWRGHRVHCLPPQQGSPQGTARAAMALPQGSKCLDGGLSTDRRAGLSPASRAALFSPRLRSRRPLRGVCTWRWV